MADFSGAHWRNVNALLGEALARPEDERAAFLEKACEGDAALLREVQSLLEAHEEADGFFTGLAREFVGPASSALEAEAEAPGDAASSGRVGPYRLIERVGEGGMGAVYRAERADGAFEQEVAVKLLRPALAAGDALRRFLRERQILASLQHPHIARVFDGGVTDRGRPYLVMEYVEGRPLDRHCAEGRCPVEERIRLVQQVAEAVQYAHQNLVVHRDLKPSNVLVTPEGEVKLVDFGIAKLLKAKAETEAPDEAFHTRTGALLMTPEYAAPEQLEGGDVTAATDVYALGVLFYELLTGQRPYRFAQHTPLEIARVVCEEEPPRPSVAVRRSRKKLEPEEDAAGRAWKPSSSTLRGDLDAIVMKALRKEPVQRYATAAALREDLGRYRKGRPIEARTMTWTYRAGRFARRYRRGLTAALAFTLLLVAYALTVTVQSQRVRRERDRAEATASFLKNVLSMTDPETGQGGAVPARVLLQQGAARLDTSFAGQPALKADLKELIGSAFRGYGLYEEALALHRDALALRLADGDANRLAIADTRNNIGEVFYYLDQPDSAEAYYRASLRARRRLLGNHHVDVAQSLNNLALLDAGREDYARGSERLKEALSIFQENLPADHWRIANVLNNLATMRSHEGALEQAERRYREALAMHLRVKGETHRDVARTQISLGSVLTEQGKYAEADTTLRMALRHARKVTTASLPVVGRALFELGELRRRQGRYAEAERRYRAARVRYRKALPPDHRWQAAVLMGLSEALLAEGRSSEALPEAREALRICRAALPPGHRRTAEARGLLGAALTAEKRYAEAERHLLACRDALRHPTTPAARRARHKAHERLAQLYDAWEKSAKSGPEDAVHNATDRALAAQKD